MKKIITAFIFLTIAAVCSVTVFLVTKSKRDKEAENEASRLADYALFRFDSDSIKKVTIDSEGITYIAEYDDENDWHLTNTDDFAANTTYFQNVCTYLSELTAEKDYGEANDEKKELYGLDDPIKITASSGSEEYTVYVGDPSPTGDVYYIMTGNKSRIYAINSLYGSVLKTSRTMMKDKKLVPFEDRDFRNIQLKKNGSIVYDLNFNEEAGLWYLPDEYNGLTTDVTKITSMINIMTRIEAQNFYDERLEDYSKYGFDKPAAELSVTNKDGITRKYLFSYYGNDTRRYTHVLSEESGQVATFYTGDVDFIEYTYLNFISKQIYMVSLNGISGIDFSYKGREDSFEVDNESTKIKMNGTPLSEISSDATEAFSVLYSSIGALELTGLDTVAEVDAENSETILRVVYHFEDKQDKTVEFIKRDEDSCYIMIDGTYTGAYISNSNLTGKNTLDAFYSSFISKAA